MTFDPTLPLMYLIQLYKSALLRSEAPPPPPCKYAPLLPTVHALAESVRSEHSHNSDSVSNPMGSTQAAPSLNSGQISRLAAAAHVAEYHIKPRNIGTWPIILYLISLHTISSFQPGQRNIHKCKDGWMFARFFGATYCHVLSIPTTTTKKTYSNLQNSVNNKILCQHIAKYFNCFLLYSSDTYWF